VLRVAGINEIERRIRRRHHHAGEPAGAAPLPGFKQIKPRVFRLAFPVNS